MLAEEVMPGHPLPAPSQQQRHFWEPCSTTPAALQFGRDQRPAQRGLALPSTTPHALKTAMTLPGADPLERGNQFKAVAKSWTAEIPAHDAPLPDAGHL